MIKSNGSEIVGRKLFTALENRPYGAFWKIPYAVPPIKELRFKVCFELISKMNGITVANVPIVQL